jgi:TonB-linked SusC/RagA family outer membrane protein
MYKKLIAVIVLVACSTVVMAQKTFSGKILDSAGSPIPGATISVNNSRTGTSSGPDGSFKINAPMNASISVTAIGFAKTQATLSNEDNNIIHLQNTKKILEEVVVTALGVKREKRNLTFSSQEIKGEELMQAKDPNIVNALSGKVSGVQITNSSGTPGGSARIVIRGATSIYGNNEALVVLDGVPIDNSETGTISQGPGSNRLVDIDPSTIASINVLKGAAATALYGSAGARGVVIITTKNGQGLTKPVVTLSSDLAFDKALYPELQSTYAQGTLGVYKNGENQKESSSYGPRIDTLKVNGVPVQKRNQLADFFKTGITTSNTISIAGSNPKSSYFLSYSYFNQTGTVPTNDFKRNTFFTKFSTRFNDKMSATIQFNYSGSDRHTVPEGNDINSPTWTIFAAPISWNPLPYLNPDGSQRVYRNSRNNPYWVIDNVYTNSAVNRLLPIASFVYTPASWLTFTERIGADIYTEQGKFYEALKSVGNPNGILVDRNTNFRQFNHDFIVDARKKAGNFDLELLLGNNILSNYSQTVQGKGVGLAVGNFFNVSNATTQTYSEYHSLTRKVGFYTQANIDYKRTLNLSLTGRYDGSSVLSKDKSFYPYGSAALGFIFTELMATKSSFLNFGKLRVSYATVGNDNVGPYSLNTPFYPAAIDNITFPFQGQNGFQLSSTLGNPSLKNELEKEFEVGLETRLLNNRVGLEVSYFDKRVTNGIIPGVAISAATGYTGTTVNSAKLNTKGVEVLLSATPVKTDNFNWDLVFTFSKINNKVVALYQDVQQLNIGQTEAIVGQPYGVIYGSRFKRTADGKLLIDADGLPIQDDTQGILGNISPDWTAGITNNIRYKNFTLSFFFDMKKGGDIFNDVDRYNYFYGMSKITENRDPRIIEGISIVDNKANTVVDNPQNYYRRLNQVIEASVQDGTFIKLRNISLAYNFGKSMMSHTPFSSASFVITGRNVFIYKPHFTGSDPESSTYGSSNGAQGTYSFSTPTSRTVNVGLKLTF